MKIAYLQCPTGIAGDMCLGAIVDAGVPLEYLIENLSRLGIAQEYHLWTEQVHRNGLRATKFHVDLVYETGETVNPDAFNTFDQAAYDAHNAGLPVTAIAVDTPTRPHSGERHHDHSHHDHSHHDHSHHDHSHHHDGSSHPPIRHLPEIEQLILQARLPERATAWSLAVFRQLAVAEGAVHGVPPEQVHFHEVGATDALVDIIGTCLGLDWLGIDRLICSSLPTGGGTIRAAHGRLPVPSPAVLKLFELGQVPIYSNGIERELVTPTGAAIATTLSHYFGGPPAMTLQCVGLGAGSSEFALPNILRLWVGETEETVEFRGQGADGLPNRQLRTPNGLSALTPVSRLPTPPSSTSHLPHSLAETVLVLETQIDDLNPQALGYVLEELLSAGALDVFTQAIAMKKSRPGILLTVICRPEDQATCEAIVFRETTTLGIRCTRQERQTLPRQIQVVETPWGPVRVKLAWADGCDRPPTNVQPEYEDCAQVARRHHLAWREVQQQTLQIWFQSQAQVPICKD